MSNEIQATNKAIESQIDNIRSMLEHSLVQVITRLESVSSSTNSHLAEVYEGIAEKLKGIRDEGRTQRSDAAHKFEKIAAHSVTQRLEANLTLLDLGREIQAIRESQERIASLAKECATGQERIAHDIDLLKLDVEFIRNDK